MCTIQLLTISIAIACRNRLGSFTVVRTSSTWMDVTLHIREQIAACKTSSHKVKLTSCCMNTVCLRLITGANMVPCRGEMINNSSQLAGQKMAMLLLCIYLSCVS